MLNVRFCSFGWCDYRENWASRAPFSYQVYNIVAGDSGVTWYPLNSNFWMLQKLGSISVFRSRSNGPMLTPIDCCHSWQLIQLASFTTPKLIKIGFWIYLQGCAISGLVKEAFSNKKIKIKKNKKK
jgi:hypothetical protein